MSQICANCRFLEGNLCRRYPGKIAALAEQKPEKHGDPCLAVWPVVDHADWCGEWQRDPNAALIEEADNVKALGKSK